MQLHRQSSEKPLYPDMLWSRPENKLHAGKLLIIGGNAHGFAAPAMAYSESQKAGIGTARVLLPDKIKKIVGGFIETAEFSPSTPSGSFSQKALSDMLDQAAWADGVLFAGDLGRNSETAIVFEKFLQKNVSQTTITKDAVDYYVQCAVGFEQKSNHALVLSLAQLQKLAIALKFTTAFTLQLTLPQLAEALAEFCSLHGFAVITKFYQQFIICDGASVVVHSPEADVETWRIKTATHASVWWLQNPTKRLESLTTSFL